MQQVVKNMSGLHTDFVASSLRSQLVTLQNILNHIESSQEIENDYVEESLKRTERELCQLRKFFNSN